MRRSMSAAVQVAVDDHGEKEEVEDDRGGDEAITQPHPGQAFRSAVIFGHGLEDDAPEEIPVDLDVPLFPTGIGRVAPAFLLEELESGFQEARFAPPRLRSSNCAGAGCPGPLCRKAFSRACR